MRRFWICGGCGVVGCEGADDVEVGRSRRVLREGNIVHVE